MIYLTDELSNFYPACGNEHSIAAKRNASPDY